MVYIMRYISWGVWYIRVKSGIYHDTTFQMLVTGTVTQASAAAARLWPRKVTRY